ncbi:rluD [Symbiodinium pilosum]|uniref:RluD protein n=1 Tax=Symbiodinium pilosum TaxID=2952 RepID=A0A812PW66_SYMPI|nr:rluD [Symbiodinium pilosum]
MKDGTVVAWGDADWGGDTSAVMEELKGVSQDGSVVTWGDADWGGNAASVQNQLYMISWVSGTFRAFLELRESGTFYLGDDVDGSVVTWGDPKCGGDSSRVRQELRGVVEVCHTAGAFAALKADGSVVAWGDPACGGDNSSVHKLCKAARQMFGLYKVFACIMEDGSVSIWGDDTLCKDMTHLQNITAVSGTAKACAAIVADGSVVAWGEERWGGDCSEVASQLQEVQQICATGGAFAARTQRGAVITWGDATSGGDSLEVWDQLSDGVVDLSHTSSAFAARKEDGSVVTWGNEELGGNSFELSYELNDGVVQLCGNGGAFAARKTDGTVVCWGDSSAGANVRLQNITDICCTYRAFAAVKENGSVVAWGDPNCGGDCSKVAASLRGEVVHLCGTFGAFAAVKKDGYSVDASFVNKAGIDASDLFQKLDVACNGYLRYDEVSLMAYAFDPELTGQQLDNLFRHFDPRGCGMVDVEGFKRCLGFLVTGEEQRCSVQDAFTIFDTNRNGFLDQNEFYRFLVSCDCKAAHLVSQRESDLIFAEVSRNTGRVDVNTFAQAFAINPGSLAWLPESKGLLWRKWQALEDAGSDLGGFAAVTTSVQHEHVPPHIVLTRCGFGAECRPRLSQDVHSSFYHAAFGAATEKLEAFDAQGLANLAWAVAALRAPHCARPLLSGIREAAARDVVGRRAASVSLPSEARTLAFSLLALTWALSFSKELDSNLEDLIWHALSEMARVLDTGTRFCEAVRRAQPTTRDVDIPLPQALVDSPGMLVVLKPPGWEVDTSMDQTDAYCLSTHLQALRTMQDSPVLHLYSYGFGFIHRLDVASSGLVLAATTFQGLLRLQLQKALNRIDREYIVLCYGLDPHPKHAVDVDVTVKGWLKASRTLTDDTGLPAESRLCSVAHLRHPMPSCMSAVAIQIFTGRRHQIRAHTRSIRHPTVCDAWYAPSDVYLVERELLGPAPMRAWVRTPRLTVNQGSVTYSHQSRILPWRLPMKVLGTVVSQP